MKIHITKKYLWFPIAKKGKVSKFHFYCKDQKFRELDIAYGLDHADFYAAMDVTGLLGEDITINSENADEALDGILCRDDLPSYDDTKRPFLHFTPPAGWMNDPNGLYFDGMYYHMYYQWNPYGTEWGNMHWGHAVSRDLIHWEHRKVAITPDEYGTVYSGSAIKDENNVAGYGKGAVLYFYTASGGRNEWSKEKGNLHTQRLAVSTDGGDTLEKKGLVISHIRGENRDPKVFFHDESRAFIMLLYLDENEFAIFRSEDLCHCKETQRLSFDGMWECPDLFKLKADDPEKSEKWVFWSADGFYVVGSFDGYRFEAESEVQKAYDTSLPYAAQTISGVKERTISIAWLRTSDERGNYRGMMSIPTELSLKKTDSGYRLAFEPVKELCDHLKTVRLLIPAGQAAEIPPMEEPVIWQIQWEEDGERHIKICGKEIVIPNAEGITTLIIDTGIIEYFSNDGLIYGVNEGVNGDGSFGVNGDGSF